MDTTFARAAGLDLHQKFITVGVRCRLETGKLFAEVRTLGGIAKSDWGGFAGSRLRAVRPMPG
jgi:hypothetical protein